tara:strand:- start:365 stop:1252 length:888 start_codon:yes stop_codon:yes gene_type:complete
MKIETSEISLPLLKQKSVRLFIKRIDKIHPFVSGNKWFKLKYNINEARKQGIDTLLTFGGAYSNHIAATAFAAKENGLKSIGVIRGEKGKCLNPTLDLATRNSMLLTYVSREDYRNKNTSQFISRLKERFGDFYLLPEGGTNDLAIKGSAEILDVNDTQDYICCSIGTGGTISGIINAQSDSQITLGFPAVRYYETLESNIDSWTNNDNYNIINTYSLGGYAKLNKSLVYFINEFYETHEIPLDIVYTGKMMYGIIDLISKGFFSKGSSILAIHTGGVQGNKGMIERLGVRLPVS